MLLEYPEMKSRLLGGSHGLTAEFANTRPTGESDGSSLISLSEPWYTCSRNWVINHNGRSSPGPGSGSAGHVYLAQAACGKMALGSDAGGLFGLGYVLSTAAAAAATAAGTEYYSPCIPMVRDDNLSVVVASLAVMAGLTIAAR